MRYLPDSSSNCVHLRLVEVPGKWHIIDFYFINAVSHSAMANEDFYVFKVTLQNDANLMQCIISEPLLHAQDGTGTSQCSDEEYIHQRNHHHLIYLFDESLDQDGAGHQGDGADENMILLGNNQIEFCDKVEIFTCMRPVIICFITSIKYFLTTIFFLSRSISAGLGALKTHSDAWNWLLAGNIEGNTYVFIVYFCLPATYTVYKKNYAYKRLIFNLNLKRVRNNKNQMR